MSTNFLIKKTKLYYFYYEPLEFITIINCENRRKKCPLNIYLNTLKKKKKKKELPLILFMNDWVFEPKYFENFKHRKTY